MLLVLPIILSIIFIHYSLFIPMLLPNEGVDIITMVTD